MKTTNIIKKLTAALLALVIVLGLAACAPAQTTADPGVNKAAGTILLSVNPQIEVEYDHRGLVLEVEGRNDDGRSLDIDFDDCIGREARTVLAELVKKIYEAGYFETTDGREKNIVIKVGTGSSYPNDAFMQEIEAEVRSMAESIQISSKPMVVEQKDQTSDGFITVEKAKELVLTHLGVAEAKFIERETELDDGEYEFEVIANGAEYDFEVNARTGKITEVDRDNDRPISTPVATSPTATVPANEFITVEEAKALILKHLGVTEAKFIERETELDDGEYEFEVIAGGVEYDFEVNARTGKITEVDRDNDRPVSAPVETSPAATAPANGFITVEEAKALILKHLGVTEAKFIERETELDDGEYEFEVIAGGVEYDFEVNARTGKITEVDRDNDRAAQSSIQTIGMDQAKALVLAHLGDANARFTDAELDDGVYELEVVSGGYEYDYKVDAFTGEILRVEKDREG